MDNSKLGYTIMAIICGLCVLLSIQDSIAAGFIFLLAELLVIPVQPIAGFREGIFKSKGAKYVQAALVIVCLAAGLALYIRCKL